MEANKSRIHICPTLEEAKAFSQARVQSLLDHEELLKRIEATPMPLRKDGMPDLNNWKEFVEQVGIGSLRELLQVECSPQVDFDKMILLSKAASYAKYELASKIVKQFAEEGLSIKDSNEIIESIQNMLLKSKVTC